jgi:hypothetical protein
VSDGTAVDIYEPVIAELESRIAALQATVDNLRSLRSGGVPSATASHSPASRVGTQVSFGHDAFFNMTAAEAAKKYLAAIKKTASVNLLSEALVSGGWKSSSKNVPENLRTILGRHADFVRINGEFGLAEWYPGRKNGTKKRAMEAEEFAEAMEANPDDPANALELLSQQ